MITDQDKDLIKRLREMNAYEQPTEAEVDLVEAAAQCHW